MPYLRTYGDGKSAHFIVWTAASHQHSSLKLCDRDEPSFIRYFVVLGKARSNSVAGQFGFCLLLLFCFQHRHTRNKIANAPTALALTSAVSTNREPTFLERNAPKTNPSLAPGRKREKNINSLFP
jgi:hypothetical protein